MDERDKKIAELEAKVAHLEAMANFRWEQTKKNLKILDRNMMKDAKHGKRADEIAWKSILQIEKSIEPLLQKLLPGLERRVNDIVEAVEDLRRRSMRYDQVYYKLFPERLIPDAKLLDQLKTLKRKTRPSGSTDKT